MASPVSKLIVYTTKGCFACKVMVKLCNVVSAEFDGLIRRDIDIDDLPDDIRNNSLEGFKDFPTTIFKHNGKEMFRLVGTYPIEHIKKCIDTALASK